MEVTLEVSGMNCGACAGHVEKALKAVSGVRAVHVDLAAKRAVVEHEGADPEMLCAAVADEGYDARVLT